MKLELLLFADVFNLITLCHSDINYMLSTDVNITRITKFLHVLTPSW